MWWQRAWPPWGAAEKRLLRNGEVKEKPRDQINRALGAMASQPTSQSISGSFPLLQPQGLSSFISDDRGPPHHSTPTLGSLLSFFSCAGLSSHAPKFQVPLCLPAFAEAISSALNALLHINLENHDSSKKKNTFSVGLSWLSFVLMSLLWYLSSTS